MAGRKPKPRELRVLEGNPGRRALPPPDISTTPVGEPPPSLGGVEQSIWHTLAAECPWLREADRGLLELFTRSWLTMVVSQRRVVAIMASDAPGDGDREMAELAQRAYASSRTDCLRMLAEMGATPATRAKVSQPSTLDADPSDRFFKPERQRAKG